MYRKINKLSLSFLSLFAATTYAATAVLSYQNQNVSLLHDTFYTRFPISPPTALSVLFLLISGMMWLQECYGATTYSNISRVLFYALFVASVGLAFLNAYIESGFSSPFFIIFQPPREYADYGTFFQRINGIYTLFWSAIIIASLALSVIAMVSIGFRRMNQSE